MALWTLAETATEFWYDASDATTRTIVTGISKLDDKSGNALHLEQADTAKQPPVSSAAINGLDAVLYADSTHVLVHTPAIAVGQTEFWLFQVWKTGTPQTYASPPVILTEGANARPFDRWHSTADGSNIFIGSTPATASLNLRTATTTFVHAIHAKKDAVSSGVHTIEEWANGALVSTHNITATWSTVSQVINVGRRSDGITIFNGLFGESALVDGDLVALARETIEGYLGWKWGAISGFDSGHSFKTAAPATNSSINAVLPIISGDATNPIVSEGSIVAPKASITGKVWNNGNGDIVSTLPSVYGEATNQVPAVGRITLRGKITGTAYNPVVSAGGITAVRPIISGRAINQEVIFGGVTVRGKVFGRATNPKAFEPIKFRRCGT